MPGILGLIRNNCIVEIEPILQKMIQCMVHEPFYKTNTHIFKNLECGVGGVTQEGSFADCLPIWNEKKNICLMFTGEVFQENSEIELLKNKNHVFDSKNASFLVHLYEELGLKFIDKLNGSFSGILIDLKKNSISLFNDRFGLGRIYYFENSDGFFFSSEAKSLLSIFPELKQLDFRGLAEIFSCGCILQNRTLFPKIFVLPGGSLWTFQYNNAVKKQTYFKRNSWEENDIIGEDEFNVKLIETFKRILPNYLSGKQNIAMSLTGGFDGRMIMAWLNQLSLKLPCYTFGSNYRECSDLKVARKVAKKCNQAHETILLKEDFFQQFPALAEKTIYISDGTMNVTGAVELYINSIARNIAPIRLTGNYGSEILRGNIAFRPSLFIEHILTQDFISLVRKANETFNLESDCPKLSFIAFKQVPWHHYSRLSVEQSQITMRSPYLDNEIVSLAYQAPPNSLSTNFAFFNSIVSANPDLASIPTDRGLRYPPLPLLTKCLNLYEEISFKAEYMFDYGMPKWLSFIDHLLAPLKLESLFLGRHKFYHFRVWYRDKFSQYLKDVLLDPISLNRPYLQKSRVESILKKHLYGQENFTNEIHCLLTAELIQRLLIEDQP